jgi:steroid 5-alpha reductase family enzyme
MEAILSTIGFSAAVIFCYMTALFFVALLLKDNSIADIFWGIGFAVVSLCAFFVVGDFALRQIVVTVLVLIWATRLSVRIAKRNWGKGEDVRYQKWRREWGRLFVVRSYLQVFLLQGLIMLLNLFPVLIIFASGDRGITVLDIVGVVIWVTGFLFESVGDLQLDRFLKDPANRGRIIDRGLWRYSRHPNYFGEITMWWGIFVIALSVPWGWVGVVGPLTISLLIVFVSGIPMTERLMDKTPGFAEYKRRTSVLIPWFPKR